MSRCHVRTFLRALLVVAISGALGAGAVSAQGDTQKVSEGGVTVTVTFLGNIPREGLLKERSGELAFKVVLDTHSVDLDRYKFDNIVFLRDEAYHWSSPAGVEAVSGSGHHREAIVKFPRPSGGLDELELAVKGVAGVKERTFRWKLQ
jgi:hypothetical protein